MYNVLYSSSRSGVDMLAVSINSVCRHIKRDIVFYILCNDWDAEFRHSFESKILAKKIVYINVCDEVFADVRNTKGLPIATLYRLCGIEMLPLCVHKILYLDIDVLCVSDELVDLFTFFEGKELTIAAIPDAGISDKYQQQIIKQSLCDYFNAGVLFINVDYCRKIQLWHKAQELLKNNSYIAVDQDILNIIFANNYFPLSRRYNYMSPQIFKDLMFYRKKNLLKDFTPIFIHFDGPQKPWYSVCANPYRALYIKEMKESGLSFSSSINMSLMNRLKVYLHSLKYKIVGL